MRKREVVRLVLDGARPPYVPWQIGLTQEARQRLGAHYGELGLERALDNLTHEAGVTLDSKATNACVRLFQERGFKFDAEAPGQPPL